MKAETSSSRGDQPTLLLTKKTLAGQPPTAHSSQLRRNIDQHPQDYHEPKPFQKRYGQRPPLPNGDTQHPTPSRQTIMSKASSLATPDPKGNTKDSFNRRLNNNIIKDDQSPSRIQLSQLSSGRNNSQLSPKKLRETLVSLNQQETQLQEEILRLHKQNKAYLGSMRQKYGLKFNPTQHNWMRQTTVASQHEEGEEEDEDEKFAKFLAKTKQMVKHSKKELSRIEKKIEQNHFLQYYSGLQEDIQEQSEEEESEGEIPLPDQPRLNPNMGSYARAMPNLKTKSHTLHQRLTYQAVLPNPSQQPQLVESTEPQLITAQQDNRVTVNSRLKGILLQ